MKGFGKSNGGGRRSDERESAGLIAIWSSVMQSHAAAIIDLSLTGARLRGKVVPDAGDQLMIMIETVRIFGTVAWSWKGECGVSFDAPLDRRAAREIRHQALRMDLPPELKAALDDWTIGLAR